VPGHAVTGNRRQRADRVRRFGIRKGTAGWEFVQVAVDDFTRLAYAEVLADEKASTAIGFLRRAIAFYAAHGVHVERVMTDNGSAYRSHAHRLACLALGIDHLRTRPYRPRTNGKAERFIQTLTGDWARGRLYANSAERARALRPWLERCNLTRPHGRLGKRPPGSRLTRAPRNDT
jgi:transposase InsO family protein